jgi:hypothetical protein
VKLHAFVAPMVFCGLTFDMSGGLTDAKRRARRPLL